MKNLWFRLFLEERPSISLGLFRIAVALTVGFHVLPSFVHLDDNYFATAFKTFNTNFFTIEFIELIQKSPEALIVAIVWIFCVSWFFFLIGLWSQLSCIAMTLACYYFYALNAFHIGTLSWDILLVTLFLMCVTPYHGDYFSFDCLRGSDENAYKRMRPFFLQRLLQIQIGFTYFYTALYKMTPIGNWITDNPIYYLLNYPAEGVTKYFLVRDFLIDKPGWCYWIGISILIIEISMVFLLFWRKTRISAIYLGIFFHILLILTLDVPAIFFFLFPPMLLLLIDPRDIVAWINQKRWRNESAPRSQLVYDGGCQFCRNSVHKLKIMDLFATLAFVDFQSYENPATIHKDLTPEKVHSQLWLIEPHGKLYGGFFVFQRICLTIPMLYPCIVVVYFPGIGVMGPFIYKIIAKNRYLLHFKPACKNNSCFR